MKEQFEIIVNSLIYILDKFENKTTGIHKLFKILYFAEQKHLSRYGKNITNDTYYALQYGPVPTNAYSIIKAARSQKETENECLNEFSRYFDVNSRNVKPKIDVDLDWLSVSERKCLDEAYEENKNLNFSQLTDKSHDLAWDRAFPVLSIQDIAKAGGATDEMLSYLSSKEELKNVIF